MEQHARTWEESPNIAKWRGKQGVNRPYTVDFDAIFFITRYRINPCSYSGFLWARCSPWDIEQRVGPSALGLHLTDDVNSLGRRRHTSIDKYFAIKSLYFSFQSTVSAIIFYSTSYMYVLDKRNTLWLRDTVRQTSRGYWFWSTNRVLVISSSSSVQWQKKGKYIYFDICENKFSITRVSWCQA